MALSKQKLAGLLAMKDKMKSPLPAPALPIMSKPPMPSPMHASNEMFGRIKAKLRRL